MRKTPLVTGELYHVFNRGADKRMIVMDTHDSDRFLIAVNFFSLVEPIGSVRDLTPANVGRLQNGKRLVSIIAYCLNPNHFHILLRQEQENGVSEFMKRLGGYTKYFNDRHSRSGVLFQGRFKSVHVAEEKYYRLLVAYIMWNDMMHDIAPKKRILVRSSAAEYRAAKFKIVSPQEARNVLDLFGGLVKLQKHAEEIISMLRKGRGKKELGEDQRKLLLE